MTKTKGVITALLVLGVMTGCDDDEIIAPDMGVLEVTVATTGDGTDDDGYTVSVDDGDQEEDVTVDGSASFDVEAGDHTVELTGLAADCAVDGDNPVEVEVESDETETVAFAVVCSDGS